MKYLEEQNITVIEIIDEDYLKEKINFLSCDLKCNSEIYKNYLNTDIFIMYHPNGEELECCSGKIIKVNEPKEFNFEHSLDIKNGSSGSPILLFEKSDDEPEVIGIQTSSVCENKNNVGTFINLFTDKLIGIKNFNKSLDKLTREQITGDGESRLFVHYVVLPQNSANSRFVVTGSLFIS